MQAEGISENFNALNAFISNLRNFNGSFLIVCLMGSKVIGFWQ